MSIFRTKFANLGATISPAALPTITLLVLLFFMVTVVLRKTGDSPEDNKSEQPGNMEQKSFITEVTIGLPKDSARYGTKPTIESGGKLISFDDFQSFIEGEMNKLPEHERDGFTVSLKVDQQIPMGDITDLTDELRKANARKLIYNGTSKTESVEKMP